MKKIVRQQNYLRSLIDSQSNKQITVQTLRSVIRAVIEPLLDNPEEGVVLHRISNKSGLTGFFKRLEFSNIGLYDFNDESKNLREKVWADTEFFCVMTHRFVVILVWDNKTESKNYVRYYTIWNSKLQDEALDIINRNSFVDVKEFQDKFRPDRRDNILFNSSIRRLVDNFDESIKDAVLGFAEYNAKPKEYTPVVREVAHEIKNQLSICDLYSEVIRKYCEKNDITDDAILNGVKNISRAVKLSANSLVALKSTDKMPLKECYLVDIINVVKDLTKVYFECKNIEYKVEGKASLKILCDEDSLIAVLINLVKNAVEAFEFVENEDELKNGKYVKLRTEKRGDFVAIRVVNNAPPILDGDKIFIEGYTTKRTGSGLGLCICKKTIESQNAELTLEHSDESYTEFLVKYGLA